MMKAGSFLALASLVALPVLSIACAPEGPNVSDEEQQSDDSALSTSTRAYVTLTKDTRKCASPMCGGWYATDVNKANAAPHYVSGLDFASSDLDADAEQVVTEAADGEIVIYGKLGPAGSHGTRKLVVTNAYRGMPDIAPASGDVFYTVGQRSPQVECFVAPCPNLTARKLNSTTKTSYATTDIALGHFIQADWLSHRVEDDGALVVGTISGSTLTASQVYLKLPEEAGICPKFVQQCPAGQIETFNRTPDRCLIPAGCVAPHPCPLFVPYCGTDYQATSWVHTNGCSMVSCDPAWIYEAQ
jgi:hypothetical protein